jgi:hypothetical protein
MFLHGIGEHPKARTRSAHSKSLQRPVGDYDGSVDGVLPGMSNVFQIGASDSPYPTQKVEGKMTVSGYAAGSPA